MTSHVDFKSATKEKAVFMRSSEIPYQHFFCPLLHWPLDFFSPAVALLSSVTNLAFFFFFLTFFIEVY